MAHKCLHENHDCNCGPGNVTRDACECVKCEEEVQRQEYQFMLEDRYAFGQERRDPEPNDEEDFLDDEEDDAENQSLIYYDPLEDEIRSEDDN